MLQLDYTDYNKTKVTAHSVSLKENNTKREGDNYERGHVRKMM